MNPLLCTILNLAVYVEVALDPDPHRGTIFGNGGSGPKETGRLRRLVNGLFGHPAFHRERPGVLGTHSFRKGPATFASWFGMPKDYVISYQEGAMGGKTSSRRCLHR